MSTLDRITGVFGRREVSCSKVRVLSSEYLENSLPLPQRSRLQVHLNGCVPCKVFVISLSATIGMLATLLEVRPHSYLKQAIHEETVLASVRGESDGPRGMEGNVS